MFLSAKKPASNTHPRTFVTMSQISDVLGPIPDAVLADPLVQHHGWHNMPTWMRNAVPGMKERAEFWLANVQARAAAKGRGADTSTFSDPIVAATAIVERRKRRRNQRPSVNYGANEHRRDIRGVPMILTTSTIAAKIARTQAKAKAQYCS